MVSTPKHAKKHNFNRKKSIPSGIFSKNSREVNEVLDVINTSETQDSLLA